MSETPPEDPNVKVLTRRFGPKLCDHCNEVLLAIESALEHDEYKMVPYHLTQSSLKNALQSGCQLCAIFINFNTIDIDTDFPSEILLEVDDNIVSVFVNKRDIPLSILKRPARVVTVPAWYFPPRNSSRRKTDINNLASARISQDLHSTPGDATDSQSAWGLCRLWLDNCVNNHQRCKNLRAGTWWPTRFLYIGDRIDGDGDLSRLSIKLCLREDEQPQGSYMTLSHCWGDPKKILSLTNSNLRYFKDVGIPYTDLPRTFQDFVRLCRFLRSDYVWVDSLCIIQDSAEDWIHESNTMADIYQCSKCNIAATSSKSPTEGCFYPRDVNLITPMEIIIRKREAGDNLSEEKHLVVQRDTWENNVEVGPLNKRCWVIQERLLSPRQIHCGRQQLLWECRENFACETFPLTFNFGQEFTEAPTAVSLAKLIPCQKRKD
ncbi:heterokaryon incompatibility protein-domain-containing protein [Annulohypoxylon nitens]|nr:heterokaryon incompatibility protein-domain-containing protein [Annulohypoxylon nitens]